MTDNNDILGKGKGKLPEDKLIAYLEGKLSGAEEREVEIWLAEEGMESDALEGLKTIKTEDVKQIKHKLDLQLQKAISAKDRKRSKPINNNPTAWIAIIIVLLLCIAAYVVLHMAAH